MAQFSCTRKIEIDAAHRVPDHGSKCFNLHGHRYVIEATVVGDVQPEGEQTGMVMDFGFLKKLMTRVIYDPCDHGTIFYVNDPMLKQCSYKEAKNEGWKIFTMDYVPTAENLAFVWGNMLNEAFILWWKDHGNKNFSAPHLARLRVYETPNCWADFPAVVAHEHAGPETI